jgi:hypothetical protein
VVQEKNINIVACYIYNSYICSLNLNLMSEVITKLLTADELAELKSQLEPNEELQFLFKYNCSPVEKDKGERFYCKNGHWNFISNYMSMNSNTTVKIKCSECDEIIFEYMPYAVRMRELHIMEIIPKEK